jgi:mycothiol synthase
MTLIFRPCHAENDYFRVRNFLREVFLLNDRLEHSRHVARLDYWRWHFIETCHITPPFEQVTVAWETEQGELAAILHPFGNGEIHLHIHPRLRDPELETEIFTYAVEHYAEVTKNGTKIIAPIFTDDILRQQILTRLGFSKRSGWNRHYWRDLNAPIPESPAPSGYVVRSMGDENEHSTRSWCSWRAFHSDEPDSNYDGDSSWSRNIQSAPLYRRDLDIIVATLSGEFAAFCTIYYDDYTRSAVTVLVGTTAEHWRHGLGKTVMLEGMRRLKRLGCPRVISTAAEEPADALYHSVMTNMKVTDTWVKEFNYERTNTA